MPSTVLGNSRLLLHKTNYLENRFKNSMTLISKFFNKDYKLIDLVNQGGQWFIRKFINILAKLFKQMFYLKEN